MLLARSPDLRRPTLLVMAATGATAAVFVLGAPLVLEQLNRGALTIAWLSALTGVVTIRTTALIPHRVDAGQLLRLAAVLTTAGAAAAAAAFVLLPGLLGAAVACAAIGVMDAVIIPANTVVGPRLPSAIRGSCMAVLMGTLTFAQALTPMLAGSLAGLLSARSACVVVLGAAGLYGAFALLRPVASLAFIPVAETHAGDGQAAPVSLRAGADRRPR